MKKKSMSLGSALLRTELKKVNGAHTQLGDISCQSYNDCVGKCPYGVDAFCGFVSCDGVQDKYCYYYQTAYEPTCC
ncbi:MAG: hypothetical protein QM528_03680 [Phycisphaerales bacterium]|nr:hypothetical protein [Phycisphaerales bacterium]